MGEFLGLMAIIFSFGWGSAFLFAFLKRYRGRLDSHLSDSALRRLQEDMDDLGSRLTRIEEDARFFRELNTPEERRPLKAGSEEEYQ